MSLSKVIEVALADLSYTENPAGSNMTKFGDLYAAVVNGTEADATVIANQQNIMAYYNSIFGT